MSNRDTVFEVRNLDVTFDLSRGQSHVVRDVDLDLFRGETLGVVGESGSGKSMLSSALLNAIVDPGQPSGDVTYFPRDGRDPVSVLDLSDADLKQFRWEEVAMVFQGAMSSFNPVMKIRSHFRETLQDHNRDVRAGMERARDLLRDVYLDPDRVLDSYPHELSGGMKQRALLALSLILNPEVLVLDEPTAGLDLLMQRSIISLLRDLQEEYDLTLVFITHDLALLTKLADRLSVQYAFQTVEQGDTEDLLYHATHPYTRALLATTPDLDLPIDEMHSIEGSKPDPFDMVPGCSYHPRCPLADEQCRAEDPPLFELGDGHRSACFHRDEAEEKIPIPSLANQRAEEATHE